jgi:hypothetical protein
MHHDTRLIPIGDAVPTQHGPATALGSSRGRWEGDAPVARRQRFDDRRAYHRAVYPGGA